MGGMGKLLRAAALLQIKGAPTVPPTGALGPGHQGRRGAFDLLKRGHTAAPKPRDFRLAKAEA